MPFPGRACICSGATSASFRGTTREQFPHGLRSASVEVRIPPGNIHPVPTESVDPDEAARAYERELKGFYGAPALEPGKFLFDVQLLGLGEDGHTASLIPGEPVLDERKRWVAAVAHGRPETRITLTYPALESSRHTAFLLSGEAKRDILHKVRTQSADVPAARIRPLGDLTFLTDRAAAGSDK